MAIDLIIDAFILARQCNWRFYSYKLQVLLIKRPCRKMNGSVLAMSERNHASMNSGGTNAGAGTRRIEYCAETVSDLERVNKA